MDGDNEGQSPTQNILAHNRHKTRHCENIAGSSQLCTTQAVVELKPEGKFRSVKEQS